MPNQLQPASGDDLRWLAGELISLAQMIEAGGVTPGVRHKIGDLLAPPHKINQWYTHAVRYGGSDELQHYLQSALGVLGRCMGKGTREPTEMRRIAEGLRTLIASADVEPVSPEMLMRLHDYWLGAMQVAAAEYATGGRMAVSGVRVRAGRAAKLLAIAARAHGFDANRVLAAHKILSEHIATCASACDNADDEAERREIWLRKPTDPAYQAGVDDLVNLRLDLWREHTAVLVAPEGHGPSTPGDDPEQIKTNAAAVAQVRRAFFLVTRGRHDFMKCIEATFERAGFPLSSTIDIEGVIRMVGLTPEQAGTMTEQGILECIDGWIEGERIKGAIAASMPAADSVPPSDARAVDDVVTLDQAAAVSGPSKRTLERHLQSGALPPPDYPGGGGRAHRWRWSTLRPALEKVCNRQLPKKWPGSRVI